MLTSVAGVTTTFLAYMRRERMAGVSTASGILSLVSGLTTSLALTAHVVSVALSGLAAHEPVVYDTEQFGLLALGIAILIPGLLCLIQSGAVMRGELHAQKRTLAASVVIAGFTLPLSLADPVAAIIAMLALANAGLLLASPTNRELSEPATSLRY